MNTAVPSWPGRAIAARRALDDAKLSGEEIDQIIVAHNFGDVRYDTIQTDIP